MPADYFQKKITETLPSLSSLPKNTSASYEKTDTPWINRFNWIKHT